MKNEELKDEKQPLFETPDFPEISGTLGLVPVQVKKQWRKDFEEGLVEATEQYPGNVTQILMEAYRAANKVFRVKAPKDHKDAREIPEWQVLRRAELPFAEIPDHVRKQIVKENGRTSGQYLELYAIDGRQYFFEVGEEAEPAAVATGRRGRKRDGEVKEGEPEEVADRS